MSNINPSSNGYNQLFPVSGVNNSTQGYRNNFTSIYNNLTIAASEISTIQNTSIAVTGDITGITPIFGSATLTGNVEYVNASLSFSPNPIFPGNSSITIPSGQTAQRASTPVNGMIRYNTDTMNIELYINTTWVILSTASNTSTYVLRNGDILTGSLTMNNSSTGQFIGDLSTTLPLYSFQNDLDTGIGHPQANAVSTIVSGNNAITVVQVSSNLIANYSTSVQPFSNVSDTTNTKIHGQFRGYQKTFEYYVYRSECQNTSLSGDWYNIMTFDMTNVTPMTVGLSCEFMASAIGTAVGVGFCVTGHMLASFLIDFGGNFITPANPVVMLQMTKTNSNYMVDVNFQIIKQNNTIFVQVRCPNLLTSSNSLDYDFSGKVVVNFGGLGILPMAAFHD